MKCALPITLAVTGLLSMSACSDVGDFSFADFVQAPDGLVSAEVHRLDGDDVALLLSEVRLRYDSYVVLRTALPMGPLLDDVSLGLCSSGSLQPTPDQFFVLDVPCHVGGQGAVAGTVGIGQQLLEEGPPAVARLSLSYGTVQVGTMLIDGLEQVDQVAASEGDLGASLVTLSLEQNGRFFDYEFRVSVLESGSQIVDYQLNMSGDLVGVRLSDPASLGGYLTATIIGIDGSISCEIRNSEWLPGDSVRGTCDNGIVFGL